MAYAYLVGQVDQTMPALFATPAQHGRAPLAQLGVGPDGTAVLARDGDRLVELIELTFGPESPRWKPLEARLRAIAAIDRPAVRGVLALEPSPPTVVLEGDSAPPLAELVDQPGCDLDRALAILASLAGAVAAAHHISLAHGSLHPWSVHVGAGDRPRFELTGLAARSTRHAWAARCIAPEVAAGAPADAAADVFAIGALAELFATSAGREASDGLREAIKRACAAEPDARPSANRLATELAGQIGEVARRPAITQPDLDEVTRSSRPGMGLRFGRFELSRQLGSGAMGDVWAASDTTGGPDVAIKLLKPDIAADAELLHRFRKEARVLARVGSPFIANFVDLNEDRGLHYLVLELVAGGSVSAALRRLGKLPERLSLSIVADTCRALAEPHRLGIVHRDVKPENVMFVRDGLELESEPIGQIVKLGDFGIARLVEHQAPEGATREGAVLGTPEYMAPEQCQGALVTPATDVYALGCCLFALIAGRPPFVVEDDNQMGVILKHLREPAPRLDASVPEVSPTVADLIVRCLEKDPKQRPQDAAELLAEIEALCDGTAALIAAHPAPPVHSEKSVRSFVFEWELKASPEALWPFVSNTEKMNRATGLAPVRFEVESVGVAAGVAPAATGKQRVAGLSLQWREHPYEWIEGSRHVVLRVFDKGVLRWYVADVQLERLAGGGTRLRNTVRIEPRGWLARFMSRFEIGVRYRRRLDRVYRRLDSVLAAGPRPEIDPIDPEVVLAPEAEARLHQVSDQLLAAGVTVEAVTALTSFLGHASDQDVARIRPLELAEKFGVGEESMIDACLHSAKLGTLSMVWDVICPSCRIPSTIVDSMAKIEEHGACKVCNLGFQVDFSRSIELAFRASSEVRDVETRTYCIGGPAHFPHVAAQVRLGPGERFALPLSLATGFYLLRSPQLPRTHELRVTASGGVRRIDVVLGERTELPALIAGDQLLTLVNPTSRELLVRVERAGDRVHALSAARVMACASFRELFPDQALAPGRLMAVTQATLVVAQITDARTLFDELGDAKAFPVAAQFFAQVSQLAREYGGSLIKTFGGLAIAAFERAGAATDFALALPQALGRNPLTETVACSIAIHRGPMMALTQGGRLDYFGQNVEHVLAIAAATEPGVIALSAAVCRDATVAERLEGVADKIGIASFGTEWVLRLRARRALAS